MSQPISRRRFLRAGLAAVPALMPGLARAAEATRLAAGGTWPTHPVRLVVPLPPGGGADIVARLIAERLTRNLGESVVVENKPGGGTVIGAESVAHAAPDGYTLLLGTATTHAINQSLVKNLPYDPIRDFEPVSLVAVLPLILVMNPAVPANNLRELLDYARRNPGKVNFASTGNGSSIQLAGEMLKMVGQVDMVHVPYRGAAPALTDLLAGRVQFMFTTIPPALPHVQAGKLKALCVASDRRSALLPDLPTTAEAGAPGVEAASWNGILAPAKTPPEIIRRLNREIVAIMAEKDVPEKLKSAGVEPVSDSPEEFARYIASETARYAKVVEASGAHVD